MAFQLVLLATLRAIGLSPNVSIPLLDLFPGDGLLGELLRPHYLVHDSLPSPSTPQQVHELVPQLRRALPQAWILTRALPYAAAHQALLELIRLVQGTMPLLLILPHEGPKFHPPIDAMPPRFIFRVGSCGSSGYSLVYWPAEPITSYTTPAFPFERLSPAELQLSHQEILQAYQQSPQLFCADLLRILGQLLALPRAPLPPMVAPEAEVGRPQARRGQAPLIPSNIAPPFASFLPTVDPHHSAFAANSSPVFTGMTTPTGVIGMSLPQNSLSMPSTHLPPILPSIGHSENSWQSQSYPTVPLIGSRHHTHDETFTPPPRLPNGHGPKSKEKKIKTNRSSDSSDTVMNVEFSDDESFDGSCNVNGLRAAKQGLAILKRIKAHKEMSKREVISKVCHMKYRSAQRKLRIAKYLDRFPEIGAMTQRHAEAYLSNKLRSRMSLRNTELSSFNQNANSNSVDSSSTDSAPGAASHQHTTNSDLTSTSSKSFANRVHVSESDSPNLIKIPRKVLYTSSLTDSDSMGEHVSPNSSVSAIIISS